MEIYSGKTLRQANLSNEYNRMLFLIFRFLENKMDNSQNGYGSVEKTGKNQENTSFLFDLLLRFSFYFFITLRHP